MIRIAVVGYGNVGQAAVETVKREPDMALAGVVSRRKLELAGIEVVRELEELEDVDVAILCTPSRIVPQLAQKITFCGISTVDSYDIHGEGMLAYKTALNEEAVAHGVACMIGAGWDPGADSVIRCLLMAMTPRGITYTNFGPGVSMGHSVAARAIPGVKDAVSFTIPLGYGRHRREVYVALDGTVSPDEVAAAIKGDPYFQKDETIVHTCQDTHPITDYGHGVVIERKGVAGDTHNQLFRYEARVTNPALTAQVMVSAARACTRLRPGAYTLIDVPVAALLPPSSDELTTSVV